MRTMWATNDNIALALGSRALTAKYWMCLSPTESDKYKTVSCGGHSVAHCSLCPINTGSHSGEWMGSSWCNGECTWNEELSECQDLDIQAADDEPGVTCGVEQQYSPPPANRCGPRYGGQKCGGPTPACCHHDWCKVDGETLCCPLGMVTFGDASACKPDEGQPGEQCSLFGNPSLPLCSTGVCVCVCVFQ